MTNQNKNKPLIRRISGDSRTASPRPGALKAVAISALLLAPGLLQGCAYVPDALNPAEWYKSTVDLFTGDDQQAAGPAPGAQPGTPGADRGKPPPGADKPFPKLGTVQRPPQGGLVGDKRQRRYAEQVGRQGPATSRLQQTTAVAKAAAPKPVTGALQPAPPAVPAQPVKPMTLGAPPQLAAAPTRPAAPVLTPPRPEALQKSFEQSLAQQLPSRGAGKTPAEGMLSIPSANTFPGYAPDQFGTVIVSAQGVELTAPPIARAAAGSGRMQQPQAALKSQSMGAQEPMPARGLVKVATILFGNGSAKLTGRDRRILSQISQIHRERGGVVRVIGHASSRTRNMGPVKHKMTNFQISMSRADQIARALMKLGIPAEQIAINAQADSNPVYYEFMPSGEAGNRRAEIYIDS